MSRAPVIKTGDFDLAQFLNEYKPKKKTDLRAYLALKKLSGYQELDWRNLDVLIPNHTYVKFIRMGTEYSSRDLESHIRGGILVNHGTYINGQFVAQSDPGTHLMLRTSPFKIEKGKKIRSEGNYFVIKNMDNYLFYKKFTAK